MIQYADLHDKRQGILADGQFGLRAASWVRFLQEFFPGSSSRFNNGVP